MGAVKNATYEVLQNLINEEMTLDDYSGVAKILEEDYENGWINIIEFGALTKLFAKKTIDLVSEVNNE